MTKGSSDSAREQLLQAAKQLFSQKGLEGTTVRELAEAAGVNVSLVSYYFEGKEGLYRACLEQFGQQRLDAATRLLQAPQSTEELRVRLDLFIEEIVQAHFTEPALTSMVHQECDKEFPVIDDIFRRTFLQMFETLSRFFQMAADKGLLREGLDPFLLAVHLISLIIHPCRVDRSAKKFHGVTLGDVTYREKFRRHLLTVFLGGIAKEKTP